MELLSGLYDCSVSNSAEQAFETLYAQQFDLVVTDISMSGMSGVDLCSLINNHFPKTAVILMSGSYSKLTESNLGSGAFGLIRKPFINTELLKLIATAVASRPGNRE